MWMLILITISFISFHWKKPNKQKKLNSFIALCFLKVYSLIYSFQNLSEIICSYKKQWICCFFVYLGIWKCNLDVTLISTNILWLMIKAWFFCKTLLYQSINQIRNLYLKYLQLHNEIKKSICLPLAFSFLVILFSNPLSLYTFLI